MIKGIDAIIFARIMPWKNIQILSGSEGDPHSLGGQTSGCFKAFGGEDDGRVYLCSAQNHIGNFSDALSPGDHNKRLLGEAEQVDPGKFLPRILNGIPAKGMARRNGENKRILMQRGETPHCPPGTFSGGGER